MTVTLARGATRMAARRVVVKRLAAIHDLGAMDVLCTDKTGTLTEARIALIGHPDAAGVDGPRVLELAAVNARLATGEHSPMDAAILAHADAPPPAPGGGLLICLSISSGAASRCWPMMARRGSSSPRARLRRC
jgi:Mg2+-importing ATPase